MCPVPLNHIAVNPTIHLSRTRSGLPLCSKVHPRAADSCADFCGTWFVTAEFFHEPDPIYGVYHAYSVGGGYHVGKFSPYVSYSQRRQVNPGSSGGTLDNHPVSTTALGIRWDFRDKFDLKLEYDRVKSGPLGASVEVANVQPGFLQNPKANVISVVVDFVF